MTPEERRAEMARRAAKGLGRGSTLQKRLVGKRGRRGRPPGSRNKPKTIPKTIPNATKAAMRQLEAKLGKQRKPRGGSHSGIKDFWAKMTPEERKAEMARRVALRAKKAAA